MTVYYEHIGMVYHLVNSFFIVLSITSSHLFMNIINNICTFLYKTFVWEQVFTIIIIKNSIAYLAINHLFTLFNFSL